jgi:hypothetical protein
MIKKQDISKAIRLFTKWDNEKLWKIPTDAFTKHTAKKSDDALRTAHYILKIMEDKDVQKIFGADNYDGTLWIINAS